LELNVEREAATVDTDSRWDTITNQRWTERSFQVASITCILRSTTEYMESLTMGERDKIEIIPQLILW